MSDNSNLFFRTHQAFENLLDIIPLIKNTDDDGQNAEISVLIQLYERNLTVINGADIEVVVEDDNIIEN